MLSIPAVVAPDVHAGLVQGDPNALHRLFDEYAPALAESAMAELHLEMAAAHVVELLFERAWNERRDFTSPEALHDWLVGEVHVMAVREQARRASLHRFDRHEHVTHAAATVPTGAQPYNVAGGWERVQRAITAASASPAEAAALRHEASRHGAAEHMAKVGRGIPRNVMIGGTVLVIAAAGGLIALLNKLSEDAKVGQALADKAAQVVTTKTGQRGDLKLDDGTVAALGADAALTIPKAFNRDFRAVRVNGAARFTVAPNPKLPFEVRAGKMQIVATGTTFTVSAYDDAPVVLSVQEGSVQVLVGKATRAVAAGSALALDRDGKLFEPTAGQRDEATLWAEGRLVIANRPLRDVLPLLKRWYQLDLRPDSALLGREVWMSARLGFADSAIVALEQAARAKQIWVGKQMVLVADVKAAGR